MDVPLDGVHAGQFVLVKFLRPRGSSAERLGIVGVKFYGYKRKAPFLADLTIDKAAASAAETQEEGAAAAAGEGAHYGTKPGHFETSKIHFPSSEEVSERANE